MYTRSCMERPHFKDHLSVKTMAFWPHISSFSVELVYIGSVWQRLPIWKDQFILTSRVVFSDRFHCIYSLQSQPSSQVPECVVHTPSHNAFDKDIPKDCQTRVALGPHSTTLQTIPSDHLLAKQKWSLKKGD